MSAIIPTYRREEPLLDTLDSLLRLNPGPAEIIVVDQSGDHLPTTEKRLSQLAREGKIRWIKHRTPSIPRAMNAGLMHARQDIVLFLDDDIIPCRQLIAAHMKVHHDHCMVLAAGRVIQPWEVYPPRRANRSAFRFSSCKRRWVREFMGGNFSMHRSLAVSLGGFDENFVRAAYRYEREFSERALAAGVKILFEPLATVYHLHTAQGGIRSYGHPLKTFLPSHAVGEYYFLFRSQYTRFRVFWLIWHSIGAIRTRHHLQKPWWIPVTLIAELSAFLWALSLHIRGPRCLSRESLGEDTETVS